jgi:hypothetical protein
VIFENGDAAHTVRTRAGVPLTSAEVGAWLGLASGALNETVPLIEASRAVGTEG